MTYWDTSYIARLYVQDPGWQTVQSLAATSQIACSLHGRAEALATFHRKLREGFLTKDEFGQINHRFEDDCLNGGFRWLPLTASVIESVKTSYMTLPPSVVLRASDALHLACASENGSKDIYSNDVRLLAAAPHFGLTGVNVI